MIAQSTLARENNWSYVHRLWNHLMITVFDCSFLLLKHIQQMWIFLVAKGVGSRCPKELLLFLMGSGIS